MDTLVRLQVSELSKGLVAAWVVTLVRPLAGVLAFVGLGSHQCALVILVDMIAKCTLEKKSPITFRFPSCVKERSHPSKRQT